MARGKIVFERFDFMALYGRRETTKRYPKIQCAYTVYKFMYDYGKRKTRGRHKKKATRKGREMRVIRQLIKE